MNKLTLQYVGMDSFSRPVYECNGTLFVDTAPRKRFKPNICTKNNNCFDGEPDTPIGAIKRYENVELEFVPKRMTWD